MSKLNIQQTINNVEKPFLKTDIPLLKIGDNVKVGVKIIEGNKAVSYTHLTLPTILLV